MTFEPNFKKTPWIKIALGILVFTCIFSIFWIENANKSKLPIKPKNNIVFTQNNLSNITIRPQNKDSLKLYLFDSLFQNWQKHHIFNGNVLMIKGNKTIYEGSFGFKNCNKNDTLNSKDVFQLASVSKQFTAVAIMQLVQKNKLKLSDSLFKHIPNLPFDSTITIHHLLSHSSGLPNYVPLLDSLHEKDKQINYINHAQLLVYIQKFKPKMTFKPGTAFQYNNTNYALLAIVLENLTGQSYNQYIQKNIFKPAKMTNSFCFDPKNKALNKKVTYGHTANGEVLYPNYLDGIYGDKGIYSSTEDMVKWQKALWENKLISKESLKLIISPKHSFENTKIKNYGYGFRLKPWASQKYIPYHTGWWHGYKSFFWVNPSDKTTVILLGNRASYFLKKSNELLNILYYNKPDPQQNEDSEE